jgi:septal ring factor EnvC (AmiA/AmiB activator)
MTKKNLSDLLREETQAPATKPSEKSTSSPSKSTPAARSGSRRGPTKADLEQQVQALTAELATSQAQETKLLDQIKGLQGDLDTQQSRLFELKDTLEKVEGAAQQKDDQLAKLTTELEAAKQVILKMSQPAPEPKPAPSSERAPLAIKMSRRAPAKHIPEYAIQRGEQKSMVSDMDIGWFD